MVLKFNKLLYSHIDAWKNIGSSSTVLDWISEGIPLPFVEEPESFCCDNYSYTEKEIVFIDQEIARLCQCGAIRETDFVPKCISPLKCAPKTSGSFRLIHDLRHLNEYIEPKKFQYDGIETVCQYIEPDDVAITLDLKNGFYHVPIQESYQTYIGFKWRLKTYVWQVLPFGLRCSPWYFYKILRPVVQFLREQNLRVVLYVDDLYLCSTKSLITDHKAFLLQTFEDLGLLINEEKSSLEPANEKEYIGYIVDSSGPDSEPWLFVPKCRIARLKKDIRRYLRKGKILARALAKITG